MTSVTESRIVHKISTLLNQARRLSHEDRQELMKAELDFHKLAPPLAALGLTRLHLTDVQPFDVTTLTPNLITNNVIFELHKFQCSERMSPIFVRKWIRILCNFSCTHLTDSMIRSRVDKVKTIQKSLSNRKKFEELNVFFSQPFLDLEIKSKTLTKKTCSDCISTKKDAEKDEKLIEALEKNNLSLEIELGAKNEVLQQKTEEISDLKCRVEKMSKVNKELSESRKECNLLSEELENVKKSSLYKKNFAYKQDLANLNVERENLERDLETERNISSKLQSDIDETKKKLKYEQTMKSKYKSSLCEEKSKNSDLSFMLAHEPDGELKMRVEGSSHRYTDEVRKTFYALQGESNVPAGNCSKIVETVAKNLFGQNIPKCDLPSSSTSLNFSNEAHVIAKHQAAEEILNSDHFTYASDATSRQKVHYLERHIILSNGKQLSLGFSEIACDDSQTLLEQCVSLFKDLCEIYCLDDEEIDANDLLKDVIKKMMCLLSDRAAVMKAFNAKVAKFKEELLGGEDFSTHFVFCNAHFLLALSAAAENALQSVEKVIVSDGGALGRDSSSKFVRFSTVTESAALRLIRLTADVLGPRGDEKSGCRREWLAFCSRKGIKSTFSSYRTNRFNNLFQNATALLRHRHDIFTFLNEFVSHSNLKLQSIIADLQDERIITSISVLSFLHVCLTEPFWQLMNSHKSHADFPVYVKRMKGFFDTLKSNDYHIFHENVASIYDDFSPDLSDISVVKYFMSSTVFDHSSFTFCLKEIVQQCDCALNRQLADFLPGGIFSDDLSEDVRNVLQSCPLTNLTGERLFGDLDYCINKSRNASLILRSTVNMWKHNQTEKWLSKKSKSVSKALIERAIKYGPEWKRKSMLEKKAVDEKVQARIAENKRIKDEKALKLAERKNAAVDAILAEGCSIASTKDELDKIYSGPKAVERMKDQIRFRTLIREEKIVMTGSKKDLYDRLLNHILKNKYKA